MSAFEPQRRTFIGRTDPLAPSFDLAGATLDAERSPAHDLPAAGPRALAPDELIGGRYRVLELLGAGGMGQVYGVADVLHPERALALKTLALLKPSRVELLKAEFRIMSELAHPHIARVYDFETLPGDVSFFTMDRVDGRALLAACAGQPPEQIAEWTVQMCRALHYLHSRGVIHADLKPQNVLVADGDVKVLDFGLSGAVGANLLLGTPAYMAPELFAGARPDERTDLYALGTTLYTILFQRLPFVADSFAALVRLHTEAPLAFPRATPFNDLIERLCHKVRAERPASADQVIDAIADAIDRSYAPETSETRRSYVASGRLVGREDERDRLLHHCLGDPEAALAAVSGPSGVGKSRLLLEVRRQLQLQGVPFLDASCYEGSFSDLAPLVEWSQSLRLLARARGCGELVERHAAALDWLDGARDTPPGGDEERLRQSRLHALAAFAIELGRTVRLVLHLGDLQWARSSTVDFLRLLYEALMVQREAGAPTQLRLLVSYRDDEVEGRPIAGLLAAVPRRLALRLPPLDIAQTAELIRALLGTPEVPEIFSSRLSHETGGNPFFIEEVLRALMERGDLYLQAGRWAPPIDAAHLELPHTIAAALERRLAALDADERELLDWLAVYAQPMPLDVLAACCEGGREATLARLERLAARHMVICDERERVRPTHDRLREFLFQGLTRERRIARHRRIAETLDALAGRDEFVLERAHHFWHAADRDQARAWARRAAELGERSFATDAAIDNYERLRQLARRDAERRLATEKLLALSLVAGQYRRIVEVTDRELARRPAALDGAWLLQLKGEALGGLGRLDEASECLRQAVALLGRPVPRGRRARRVFIAWHYLHHVRRLLRPPPAAALLPAERRRREILGVSYFLLSVYALLRGDDEGVGVNFAAYNAAQPLGPGELLLRLTQNVALGHHVLGRYRFSEQLIREARRMAKTPEDRAAVLVTELLCRQSTQQPAFTGQGPIHAYEDEVIAAVGLLPTRSKAIFVNVARVVATTSVSQFAWRFRDRPEVTRWAEAMHGTVHYPFVQGGAAMMALIAGDRARAEQGWARATEADATPFYRAWLDANFAWTWARVGDRARALRRLHALAERLPSLDTRLTTALPVVALSIVAVIAVEAGGVTEPSLRACLEESVRRLERRRRLPPYLELARAVGRYRLGRGSLAELERARRRSAERWQIEQSLVGHPDGCVAAALALCRSVRPADRAAAAGYAAEAMCIVDERYPAAFAAGVRALLAPAFASGLTRER